MRNSLQPLLIEVNHQGKLTENLISFPETDYSENTDTEVKSIKDRVIKHPLKENNYIVLDF